MPCRSERIALRTMAHPRDEETVAKMGHPNFRFGPAALSFSAFCLWFSAFFGGKLTPTVPTRFGLWRIERLATPIRAFDRIRSVFSIRSEDIFGHEGTYCSFVCRHHLKQAVTTPCGRWCCKSHESDPRCSVFSLYGNAGGEFKGHCAASSGKS